MQERSKVRFNFLTFNYELLICWSYSELEALKKQLYFLELFQLVSVISNCIENRLVAQGKMAVLFGSRYCG